MVEPQWLVDNLYDLWNVGNDLVNIPVRETSQSVSSCVNILCVNNYKFVIYIYFVCVHMTTGLFRYVLLKRNSTQAEEDATMDYYYIII